MTISNTKTSVIEKSEEFLPTVPSQASPYIHSIWDFVSKISNLDQNNNTASVGATKPFVSLSSADMNYHENSNPAALPIGTPRMAGDDLITGPIDFFMPLTNPQQWLVKDDVFLAQPSSRDYYLLDQDDNASLSSHSSASSNHDSQHQEKPASAITSSPPCLSPVTSPTNFLYNNEPLFDGLGDRILLSEQEDEDSDDDSIVYHHHHRFQNKKKKKKNERSRRLSTSNDDLDWYKLLDAFHADVACDLAQSGSETDEDALYPIISSGSSTEDEFDDDEEENDFGLVAGLKRKRVGGSETPVNGMFALHLSDEEEDLITPTTQQEEDDEESTIETAVRRHPRQKRRRKSKASSFTPRYRKYQKKKPNNDKATSTKKNHHNDDDKKKSSEVSAVTTANTPNSQLIEFLAEESDSNTTVFQHLTESGIDWCRYCGTTEGVNWRPGPWGKRTLCNKHGCDYKGYGLASRLPRLDLSAFVNESLKDRLRPVVQQFCIICQSPEETENNKLILCDGGCSRAYHQECHSPAIHVNKGSVRWYCSALCKENRKRNKVVVELPRKHMPLMQLLFKPL